MNLSIINPHLILVISRVQKSDTPILRLQIITHLVIIAVS